jgi:hypothetical protein
VGQKLKNCKKFKGGRRGRPLMIKRRKHMQRTLPILEVLASHTIPMPQ